MAIDYGPQGPPRPYSLYPPTTPYIYGIPVVTVPGHRVLRLYRLPGSYIVDRIEASDDAIQLLRMNMPINPTFIEYGCTVVSPEGATYV